MELINGMAGLLQCVGGWFARNPFALIPFIISISTASYLIIQWCKKFDEVENDPYNFDDF